MKLIVGLGNPGKEYKNTRHNVGFIILDNYLRNERWLTKDNYEYIIKNINNEKVIFLKPLTYMNLSGFAVIKVVNFYKINCEDILVIHDDLDLKCGQYRFKFDSSAGGHNGIKSIISSLGTQRFCHLKVGIGHEINNDVRDYVLGNLSKSEIENLESQKYSEMIDCFIVNGIEKCMNIYNKKGE